MLGRVRHLAEVFLEAALAGSSPSLSSLLLSFRSSCSVLKEQEKILEMILETNIICEQVPPILSH